MPTRQEQPEFSLDVRRDDDGRVAVVVRGELDMTTAAELRAVVGEQLASGDVLMDLRDLEFMDSSGIAALDALLKHADREGSELVFCPSMRQPVVRVLEMTGMLEVLRLSDADGGPS